MSMTAVATETSVSRTIKKPYKQAKRSPSPNHGGARPGSGKKPLYADEGAMSPYSCMLTPKLREKITRNGGANWIRDLISQANDAAQATAS